VGSPRNGRVQAPPWDQAENSQGGVILWPPVSGRDHAAPTGRCDEIAGLDCGRAADGDKFVEARNTIEFVKIEPNEFTRFLWSTEASPELQSLWQFAREKCMGRKY
jgi:hypothetical protein